ncbi:MAG: peptide/nickel transport system permease protein [Pseudonocardiales bacterium]|nr:peptide/nickel transport system permease protein [Pseudonocardiales bacterium]
MTTVVGFRRRTAIELGRFAGSRHRIVDVTLVGLLAVTTMIALFAHVIAPYNPIQPVGDFNLSPFSPHH